jgi:multicomponent Na+:H+ antiporter subunit E
MSPEMRTRRDGTASPRRKGAVNPMLVIMLTVLWVALWYDINAFNIISGLIIAVGLQLAFPLPPLRIDGRPRPLRLIAFGFVFTWSCFVASLSVAYHVLQIKQVPRNAVIEVDLRSESDFILTLVAIVTSLVPGSVVVEARRSTHTLFIHSLGTRDEAAVERERERVLKTERQLVRAFGDPAGKELDR